MLRKSVAAHGQRCSVVTIPIWNPSSSEQYHGDDVAVGVAGAKEEESAASSRGVLAGTCPSNFAPRLLPRWQPAGVVPDANFPARNSYRDSAILAAKGARFVVAPGREIPWKFRRPIVVVVVVVCAAGTMAPLQMAQFRDGDTPVRPTACDYWLWESDVPNHQPAAAEMSPRMWTA
jgi:hypothetical protein